jgi:hypothetical protein
MLQLDNRTPFGAVVNVLPDHDGVDTLFVVVRATLALAAAATPLDEQPPPPPGDEYFGEPGASSLKYASALHLVKPGTDVVVIGSARPARGRQVTEMLVGLTVGPKRKVVQVLGDRTWRRGGITPPRPFTELPLLWERAYGGVHRIDGRQTLEEPRNPVGVGFPGKRPADGAIGERLPNLEDPRAPLTAFGQRRDPVGFGFIAPSWEPRRSHAGTYDQAWQRTRAPYLPRDFDPRFFNAAPADQVFSPALTGGEPVELVGLHPDGNLALTLPRWDLRCRVRIAGRTEAPPFRLDTVMIEPDANRLGFIFRAAVGCDKQALRIESVVVEGGPQV